eukprot:m.204564 g.204564  ORF g.204564 m.204564 type:complete len:217 (+) comp17747_c0_seq1:3412-4062(+)
MSKKADIKIVIIGDSGVGKTAMMQRFVTDVFLDKQIESTIGVSFIMKEWKGLHLALWDTGGMEKFAPLTNHYARGAAAAIVVYDVTDRVSFERAEKHLANLKTHAQENCVVLVAGTKYDLVEDGVKECQVTADEGRALAKRTEAKRFYETSAKTGMNIAALFDHICKELFPDKFDEKVPARPPRRSSVGARDAVIADLNTPPTSPTRPTQSGGCCN